MIEKKSSEILKSTLSESLDEVISRIISYLKDNIHNGDFVDRNFYGQTFFAASLHLLEKEAALQEQLVDSFLVKEKRSSTEHEEFNVYALQFINLHESKIELLAFKDAAKFRLTFLRKVSNWVLLRSLVRIKRGGFINKLSAYCQSIIILKLNRSKGFITDNTLRSFFKRNSSRSSQYHAYATMLAGELYIETNFFYFRRSFFKGLELLMQEIEENGKAVKEGRGEKQIFGYAALLHSLIIAHSLTKQTIYLEEFERVFNYVKSYQNTNGMIPLVLSHTDQQKYMYPYNNLFDYLPFLLFYLVRSSNYLTNSEK